MKYEKPDVSVDVVLLTLINGRLHVALKIREAEEPPSEKGKWEVTGGYIHTDEDRDSMAAAKRTLHAKLEFEPRHMEQVYTEANDHRDPRGWSASIVHLALHEPAALQELVSRRGMQLVDAEDDGAHLPVNMAFDHKLLIAMAIERLRAKSHYSTIVGHFLPRVFMLSDLQDAYHAVWQDTMNPANFRHKILSLKVLEETDERLFSSGRPATGFRLIRQLEYFQRHLP